MKTISDYTIYCTPKQTKKALELGAPIEKLMNHPIDKEICDKYHFLVIDETCYNNPTAEQMIRWLRTKGCTPYVYPVKRNERDVLSARLLIKFDEESRDSYWGFGEDYSIILYAIDAALEYLSKKQK